MVIVRKIKPTKVKLDGSSLWSDTRGKVAIVTEIIFEHEFDDEYSYPHIWVKHNLGWPIYTDEGFDKGISKIISKMIKAPVSVSFTEQGMQENRKASMSPDTKASDKRICKWMKSQ